MKRTKFFTSIISAACLSLTACSAFISDINKLTYETEYTVKHFFEQAAEYNAEGLQTNLNSDGSLVYKINDDYTETKKANSGDQTKAAAKLVDGFTSQPVTQAEVKKDGSTEITIFYKRNSYTVNFNTKGGAWDYLIPEDNPSATTNTDGSIKYFTRKYGSAMPEPDTSRLGKRFSNFTGWTQNTGASDSDENPVIGLPEKIGAQNYDFYAVWENNGGTPWKVSYLFESPDSTDSADYEHYQSQTFAPDEEHRADPYEMTNVRFETEENTDYVIAKTFEGFSLAKDIQQQSVKPDGSTVVNVYFKRSEYSIILNPGKNKTDDACWNYQNYKYNSVEKDLSPKIISAKYGAAIDWDKYDLSDAGVKSCEFNGWIYSDSSKGNEILSLPETMPLGGEGFTATWKELTVKYNVQHLFEKTGSKDSSLEENFEAKDSFETEEKEGLFETLTEAVALNSEDTPGFTAVPVTQKEIEKAQTDENGDPVYTTVKVFYTRNSTTITLDIGCPENPTEEDIACWNYSQWKTNKSSITPDTINKTFTGKFEERFDPADQLASSGKKSSAIKKWLVKDADTSKRKQVYLDSLPATFPAADTTYVAVWGKTDKANYTVHCWFEKTNSVDSSVYTEENYEYNSALDQTIQGYPEATTEAVAESVEGFTACPVIQKEIVSSGTTVVDIYYTRNVVSVTLDISSENDATNPACWNYAEWKADQDFTIPDTEAKIFTGKYGTKLDVSAAVRNAGKLSHYISGWNSELPETFPSADATFTAVWTERENVSYTVNHWFEKLGSSINPAEENETNYALDESKTETMQGKPETFTAGEENLVEGFSANPITQKEIALDGSTVVDIYYTRNLIAVTLDLGSDSGSTPCWNYAAWKADPENVEPDTTQKTLRGKFGSDLITSTILSTAGKKSSSLEKWQIGNIDGNYTETLPDKFPDSNITFTAIWNEMPDAIYTVKHWFEKLGEGIDASAENESNYSVDNSMTETLSGKPEDATAASANEVSGFTVKPFSQEEILSSGETVVDIYYTRNEITVTLKIDSAENADTENRACWNYSQWKSNKAGIPQDTADKVLTGKFGSILDTSSVILDAGKKSSALEKWHTGTGFITSLPETFPSSDTTYTAVWNNKANVNYTVKHWFEKTGAAINPSLENEDNYSVDDSLTDSLSGKPEATTAALAKVVAGFTARPITQEEILPSGETVVDVFYARNQITVTLYIEDPAYEGSNKACWNYAQWKNDKTHVTPDRAAKTFTGKFEERFDATAQLAPSGKQSSGISKWQVTGSSSSAQDSVYIETLPGTFPATDTTYTAVWAEMDKVNYTVHCWFEKTDIADATEQNDTNYELKEEYNRTSQGLPEGTTSVTAETVTGFTASPITQKEIVSSGTTVVDVYYTRNPVSIIMNPGLSSADAPACWNYAAWKNGTESADTGSKTIAGKFGNSFKASSLVASLGKKSSDLEKWQTGSEYVTSLPEKFPLSDVTYTAIWTDKTSVNYTVKHWFEKLGDSIDPSVESEDNYVLDGSRTVTLSGKPETTTAASAVNNIPGFTARPFNQVEILPEETVVNIYYSRNEITITLNIEEAGAAGDDRACWNYAAWKADKAHVTADVAPKTFTGKYGAALNTTGVVSGAGKKSSRLEKWQTGSASTVSLPNTYPAGSTEYTAVWVNVDSVDYTVQHWFEKTGDSINPSVETPENYFVNNSMTETKQGLPEGTTAAESKIVAGFTASPITQAEINSSGTTVVNVYYTRNEITITLNIEETGSAGENKACWNYAAWKADKANITADVTPKTFTGKYGTTLNTASVISGAGKKSHSISTWNDGNANGPVPATFPAEDTTYTAVWEERTNVNYTVKHWFEKESSIDPETESEANYVLDGSRTVTLSGKPETTTAASAVNNIPGFTARPFNQVEILPEETVVNIYYSRNEITITLNIEEAGAAGDDRACWNYAAWKADKAHVTPDVAPKTFTGKYGTTLNTEDVISTVGKKSSKLDKWQIGGASTVTLPNKYPSSNAEYTALWVNVDSVNYTVNHWFEKLGSSINPETESEANYAIDNSLTETKQGLPEGTTAAASKEIAGFTSRPFTQTEINAAGTTVVNVYYTRNEITVTLKLEDGNTTGDFAPCWNYSAWKADKANVAADKANKIFTGKFGAVLDTASVVSGAGKKSHGLSTWNDGSSDVNLPVTFPASDTTYTAVWEERTNVNYTVKHWFEKVGSSIDPSSENEDNYELNTTLAETETLTGKPEATTAASANTIAGFTARSITQKEISANGDTVVDVYYARKTVTVTLNIAEEIPAGEYRPCWNYASWKANKAGVTPDVSPKTFTGKYGAVLNTATVVSGAGKKSHDIIKWNDGSVNVNSLPVTFPASDAAYTAVWAEKANVNYTVKHWFEKVGSSIDPELENEDNYELNTTLAGTETLTGRPEATTSATTKTVIGFTARSITQKEISENGDTVVNVYYTRKTVTVTLKLEDGNTTGDFAPCWNYAAWKADKANVAADKTNKIFTGKFGAVLDTASVVSGAGKKSHVIVGWNITGQSLPETFPAANETYTAVWAEKDTVNYTVKHWFEKTGAEINPSLENEDNYELNDTLAATETLTGRPEATTAAAANTIAGFTARPFSQVEILPSGMTVVNIYYARKTVTVTLNIAAEITAGEYRPCWNYAAWKADKTNVTPDVTPKTFTGKYGAALNTASVVNGAGKKSHDIIKWNNGSADVNYLPTTFPASDAAYTAVWAEKDPVNYTVKHWFEKLGASVNPAQESSDNYAADNSMTETKQGKPETTTAATAKVVEGFSAREIIQAEISENGDTVVNVYYARNEITITLNVGSEPGATGDAIACWNYAQWKADKTNVTPDKANKTFTGKFGSVFDASALVDAAGKKSYAISSWKLGNTYVSSLPVSFPAANETYTAVWTERDSVNYTVKHWFEKTGDAINPAAETEENYSVDETKTETKQGKPEALSSAVAKTVSGFTARPITQKEIISSGSTVVNVYYARNSINVVIDPDDGIWNYDAWKADKTHVTADTAKKTLSGKYGNTISYGDMFASLKKVGQNQNGFSLVTERSGSPVSKPAVFPDSNVEYKVLWVNKADVNYKVEHWFEKLGASIDPATESAANYSLDTGKTKTLSGRPDYFTSAVALDVTGFTAKQIQQKEISEDGTTTVQVYYTRNTYRVTFDANGGFWNYTNGKNDSAQKVIEGKFGSTFSLPDLSDIGKTTFNFENKWTLNGTSGDKIETVSLPTTIPSEDKTYYAVWTLGDGIRYTIQHSTQDLDDEENYTVKETVTGAGVKETLTEATAITIPGFTVVLPISQQTIQADGSTVVTVKYTRNSYKFIFDANGGSIASGAEVTGKFGSAFNPASTPVPTKSGWTFAGWKDAEGNLLSKQLTGQNYDEPNNKTFTAYWLSTATAGGVSMFSDITLTKVQDDEKVTCTVTLPANYDQENWTYKWYIDGVYVSDRAKFEMTNDEIKADIGKGIHTVTVKAVLNNSSVFTKQVTIRIN